MSYSEQTQWFIDIVRARGDVIELLPGIFLAEQYGRKFIWWTKGEALEETCDFDWINMVMPLPDKEVNPK